jgi:hypothetical protein
MKQKLILWLFALILLAAVIPSQALTESYPYPYSNQPFISNQYYSVVFDGEGEAAVLAKINIVNIQKNNLNEVSIEIPGEIVRVINTVQQYTQNFKQCSDWENKCSEMRNGQCLSYENVCARWGYSYNQPVFYTLEPEIQRLSRSSTVRIKFQKPIAAQETATIVIYYKATGYVKHGLGVYDFDFETIKVPYDMDNARVAVNVGSELYLKGGESRVSYLPNFGLMEKSATTLSAAASTEMTSMSRNIEYQQGFVKTSSGLDPYESFHVTGKYSASKVLLYAGSIILWIIIIALSISAVIFGFRRIHIRSLHVKVVLSGLFSSIGLMLLWALLAFLLKNLYKLVGSSNSQVLALLIVLIGILSTILIIAGPIIYFWAKYGAMKGLWVFVSLIVWLIIIGLVTVLFFSAIHLTPPVMYAAQAVTKAL